MQLRGLCRSPVQTCAENILHLGFLIHFYGGLLHFFAGKSKLYRYKRYEAKITG